MNNIQLTCSGNCFTKPLMCWSLLDYMCVIGLVIAIGVIVFVILDKKKGDK